jgi:hypothetical protein
MASGHLLEWRTFCCRRPVEPPPPPRSCSRAAPPRRGPILGHRFKWPVMGDFEVCTKASKFLRNVYPCRPKPRNLPPPAPQSAMPASPPKTRAPIRRPMNCAPPAAPSCARNTPPAPIARPVLARLLRDIAAGDPVAICKVLARRDATWLPIVRRIRPAQPWGDVVRVLNQKPGAVWTVERLRRTVRRLAAEGIVKADLLDRARPQGGADRLVRLVAGIKTVSPDWTLQQMGIAHGR